MWVERETRQLGCWRIALFPWMLVSCTTSARWWYLQQSGFFFSPSTFVFVSSNIFCAFGWVRITRIDTERKVNNVDWTKRVTIQGNSQLSGVMKSLQHRCPQSSRSVERGMRHFSRSVSCSGLCVGFIFHDSITKRSHMVIQTGPALKFPPS